MLNEKESRVLEIIQRRGPTLPIDIAKELGMETFLASAILSTLINKGYIKISHRKVGSSPLYYVSGQEQQVRNKLYPELNELEKKALARLKELRVAFREDLYPQERVLLSELRDFVDYLQIKKDDKEFFCWRHYSVTDEEFNQILKERLEPEKIREEVEKEVKEVLKEEKQEIKEIKLTPQAPKKRVKKTTKTISKNAFDKKVTEYLQKIGAEIISEEVGRTESNYIILLNTSIGPQKFLVKSKSKKSISEGDVSKLYVEATSAKLPAILITQSTPSKKVMDYISKNFGGLIRIMTLK